MLITLAMLGLSACTPSTVDPIAEVDPWDPDAPLSERCFDGISDGGDLVVPEYDQFDPVVPRHCSGTDHQDISGVGKVAFLGDSITAGTPPTPADAVYRARVTSGLAERFGADLQVENCAEWGARVDDLLGEDGQIEQCLAGVQDERVLVVMTMGGNDLASWAEDLRDGSATLESIDAEVDAVLADLSETLHWFRDQAPTRFPAGIDLIYGNVYEYTDGTGDMSLCPSASILGFEGQVPGLREAAVRVNEGYVQLAVETGFDVLFMLEHFCGHGFLAGDPDNECFRGADAQVWFDDSCIHPNPAGHEQIANMFLDVVDQ